MLRGAGPWEYGASVKRATLQARLAAQRRRGRAARARSYVATGVTSVVTSATTAGGRPGWLPNNLNQGRLDLYYTVLVLLSAANVLFFLLVAHFYRYKQARARARAGVWQPRLQRLRRHQVSGSGRALPCFCLEASFAGAVDVCASARQVLRCRRQPAEQCSKLPRSQWRAWAPPLSLQCSVDARRPLACGTIVMR